MRKRRNGLFLRLSDKEMEHLERQATASGLSRSTYLRKLIKGHVVKQKPCTHHADILRKISGMCNNINQIARVANTYAEVTDTRIKALQDQVEHIWRFLKEW